jgi:NosR/NirI family transcriptional regulator, nitrous oxide reductase regulator
MRRIVLIAVAIIFLAACADAIERFPPPQFTGGHQLPTTATPPARAEYMSWVDTGVLAAALLLGSYLVLSRRSRRGIALLTVFSIAYFGFYRKGCVCSVGSIQNVTSGIFDPGYALPAMIGFFFILPLAFSLVTGRTFCGGVCPLGAIQDVVLLRPLKVPGWLSHPLGLLPWVYLGSGVLFAATGTAYIICEYDPFVGIFRLGGAWPLYLGIGLLGLGVYVGRPYCRFLCPYGALLRIGSWFSKWRVTISPNECVNCRLCESSCPFGAIRRPVRSTEKGRMLEGKSRLAALLVALPVVVCAGALLGYLCAPVLSHVDATVRLADQVYLSQGKQFDVKPNEIIAFEKLGQAPAVLYAKALGIREKYRTGSAWLGGWVALVVMLKLITLSVRRQRGEYEADAGDCLACGRCFKWCPVERAKQGLPSVCEAANGVEA